DLLELVGDHGAHRILGQPFLELFASQPRAHFGGGRRPEVGGDQRLLDLVQRLRVEACPGEEAAEILAEPVRGLAEAGAHALQPRGLAHAGTPTRAASLRPITLTSTISPSFQRKLESLCLSDDWEEPARFQLSL